MAITSLAGYGSVGLKFVKLHIKMASSLLKCNFCNYTSNDVKYVDHHLITKHPETLKISENVHKRVLKIPIVQCNKFSPFGKIEKFYLASIVKRPTAPPTLKYRSLNVTKIKINQGCQFCIKASRDWRLEVEDIIREKYYKTFFNTSSTLI